MQPNKIALYQFPISHYCEKIRWALDHKGIVYETKNLVPGLHTLKTKKIAPRGYVPILAHQNNTIQGSARIISYLDETFEKSSLTPQDEKAKIAALDWEQYADREIGDHVRRICYNTLLEHPDIITANFSHNGPWYGRLFLKLIFPKLRKSMRKYMDINDQSAEESKRHLKTVINKLHSHYESNDYLAGDTFTRADVSVASLLAPLCAIDSYRMVWPTGVPDQFLELVQEFQEKTGWVRNFYLKYR